MKSSNFRATIFSSVAGVLLGLAIFLSVGSPQMVAAGDGCPAAPSGCAFFGCFTSTAKVSTCKYIAQENGASCHIGGACSPDGEGGFQTDEPPTN